MYAVILSDAALQDLAGIVQFIARDNPAAAERVGLRLVDVAMTLEVLPRRGSRVRKHRGVFKLIHRNYIVSYRIEDSSRTVHILGFTHGARIK